MLQHSCPRQTQSSVSQTSPERPFWGDRRWPSSRAGSPLSQQLTAAGLHQLPSLVPGGTTKLSATGAAREGFWTSSGSQVLLCSQLVMQGRRAFAILNSTQFPLEGKLQSENPLTRNFRITIHSGPELDKGFFSPSSRQMLSQVHRPVNQFSALLIHTGCILQCSCQAVHERAEKH